MKYSLLIILLLSGCTLFQPNLPVEKLVYVTTPLYVPEHPILPTWKYEDIECLSPDMIQKILDRDTIRADFIERLEVIITSTQKIH